MSNSDSKFSVQPPWLEYPGNESFWGGWRQGGGEAWLVNTWFPFWNQLTQEEQRAYLEQYPPPDEDWLLYMNYHLK